MAAQNDGIIFGKYSRNFQTFRFNTHKLHSKDKRPETKGSAGAILRNNQFDTLPTWNETVLVVPLTRYPGFAT